MTKRPDPKSQGYTNALLEDINGKIQVILEATQPIPEIQAQIGSMEGQIEDLQEQSSGMQGQIRRILDWENDVKLVPTLFDEVGKLRIDVDSIKVAVQDINRRLALS